VEKEFRIKKLKEITEKGTPYMTGIRIRYRGKPQEFKAYQIPLDFLIYNKYNGRIGSAVKSFEKEKRELDPEVKLDKDIIEDFLWQSKVDRNKNTMDDLVKNTQREYGIVTADGMIIDGNRRALLLNKIWADREGYKRRGINVDHCQYFIAVILPQDADKKEMMKLETSYQMGEDKKLDYNPIEKYLKCKDLREIGFKVDEIAEMMNEAEGKIKEWLQTMTLMDEYLDYLGYTGIYTRLDKSEDLFLNLNKALKSYQNGRGTRWNCEDLDINELKLVAFDLIRVRYEGKAFRDLVGGKGNPGVFGTSPGIWKDFLEKHKAIREKHVEKSPQEMRKENPKADVSQLYEARDEEYKEKASKDLSKNLEEASFKVEAKRDKDKPLELATKAIDLISSIDRDAERFSSKEVLNLLMKINRMTGEMINEINKKGSN
jgi:hypothetical protein